MQYGLSLLDIYHPDKEADLEISCIVEITRDKCVVRYDEEGLNPKRWEGEKVGAGHYVLHLLGGSIKHIATLHRIPESVVLEGSWQENNYRGMWRIKLQEISW